MSMQQPAAVRVAAFATPVNVGDFKDALLSPTSTLLALRGHDNALQLYSLAEQRFVSGFRVAQTLLYDFVSPDAAERTFLVAVNGKGSLMLYEHRGRTRQFINVRVVLRASNDGSDPVLARLDVDDYGGGGGVDVDGSDGTLAAAHAEMDERICCWEIALERIGALVSKKDKLLAVLALATMVEGRHVVLLVRAAKNALLVVVMDITGRSLALRRWWTVPDDVVDMTAASGVVVCLGRDALHVYLLDGSRYHVQRFATAYRPRAVRIAWDARWVALDQHTVVAVERVPATAEAPPGLCDVGPRSLGTADADYSAGGGAGSAVGDANGGGGARRPWRAAAEPVVTSASSLVPPTVPPMLSVACDGRQRWLLVGNDGLYVVGVERDACIRATLVFEGAPSAFAVAAANGWDAHEIRLLSLQLALQYGDVAGARSALAELPVALRAKARQMASSSSMSWALLREWTTACMAWAEHDADQHAALAVKDARLARWATMTTAQQTATPQKRTTTQRSLFHQSSSAAAAAPASALLLSWKPPKALRRAWDAKSDEEVVRAAALSGRLSEAVAFLRWRNDGAAAGGGGPGASPAPSPSPSSAVLVLAREAVYRALCRGELQDATTMIGNAVGSHAVPAVLLEAFMRTVRPSVRALLASVVGALAAPAQALAAPVLGSHHGCCLAAEVDDHPHAWRWAAEEKPQSAAGARVSLAWLEEWGADGVRDVMLDAATIMGGHGGGGVGVGIAGRLAYCCRHGDERAARKLCATADADEVRSALLGAAPYMQRTVLLECARHGVHPHGHDVQRACAAGAMLVLPETGRACVLRALEWKRAPLLHTLLDAGVPLVAEDFGGAAAVWASLALAVRRGNVLAMSAHCVELLHGLHMGRPLIGVAHALYAGDVPDEAHLRAMGCANAWAEKPVVHRPFSLDAAPLVLTMAEPSSMSVAASSFSLPSRSQWLLRERPFCAFLERADEASATSGSEEARTALLWLQGRHDESRLRRPIGVQRDWVDELLEASLDAQRPISEATTNQHVERALQLDGASSGHGDEWSRFLRCWTTLGMRGSALALQLASSVRVDEAMALLDECMGRGAAWDVGHLLDALRCAEPFALWRDNWKLIMEHGLDAAALLRASRTEMVQALCARALWDAARRHDPEHRHAVTLAQAERLQPQWARVAALFEAERVAPELQAQYWMAHTEQHADIAMLPYARRVTGGALEVRYLLAEGGCSWQRYSGAADAGDAAAMRQSAAGALAARDAGSLQRAAQLCALLGAQCAALTDAQRASGKEDALTQFAVHYVGDAGWTQWAQGELLRLRAARVVASAASVDAVAAELAASGQLALAREWVLHFRPDVGRVSAMLGNRYVDALRRHYPTHVAIAEVTSLASPSSRAASSSSLLLDVGMTDAQWADYVSIGGAPRDVGDVLLEVLCREQQLVCAVELCVRAYACYTMACFVQGMERVLGSAVALARTLVAQGLFQHVVRLVTGVGNYGKLEFCFGALLEAEQFELILRKNPMMTVSARLDLRMSLHRYLKKHRPDDARYMSLLMLSFGMFREIGESLEQQARAVMDAQPSAPRKALLVAMGQLIDAADAFAKDRCLQAAERCLARARALRVRIRRPRGASTFADAAAVARGAPKWWVGAIVEHTLVRGDLAFFQEALLRLAGVPLPELYRDIVDAWRALTQQQQQQAHANLVTIIQQCPDIFLAFDLCMELSLDTLADDLASKNPAIRAFKLLRRVKE